MSGSARVAAVALCAAVAACEPPVEPIAAPAPRIVVHAVLDLGSDFQFVLLERTGGQGFPGIEGAMVTVSTATGTVQATEDARAGVPTIYRFSRFDVPGGLNPGATYRLRVVTPDGDTVTGVTTVPNTIPVLAPANFGTFKRLSDTLRLVWQRVPGAKSYHVSLFAGGNGVDFVSYSTFADTSIAIPGTARTFDGDDVFPAGTRVAVVVAAVEDNYYTYFHAGVDPFAGAPPSRLTGALGVFGAVVPVIDRRYDVQ